MKHPIPIRILDGGLGTSLEDKYRVKFSLNTPLWSSHLLLSDQKTLLECQTDFAEAGADILLTATYQVSIGGFAATRTPEWPRGVSLPNIGQFLEDAVLITESAGGRHGPEVAVSLGPYGATMVPSTEYTGAYDEDHVGTSKLARWHFERAMLFAKQERLLSRVHYLAFETIPRLDEVKAVREVLTAFQIPGWISCVFPGDDDRLPDGSTVEDVVTAALAGDTSKRPPWGIGINCTKVQKLGGLVKKFEKAVQGLIELGDVLGWPSLVLYPDGTNGEVYNTTTKIWELPAGSTKPEVCFCRYLSALSLLTVTPDAMGSSAGYCCSGDGLQG